MARGTLRFSAAFALLALAAGCGAEPEAQTPTEEPIEFRTVDPIAGDVALAITPRVRRFDERARILRTVSDVLGRHYMQVRVIDERTGRIEARTPVDDRPAGMREHCEADLYPQPAGWWLRVQVIVENASEFDPRTRETLYEEPRVNRFLSRSLLQEVRGSLPEGSYDLGP